MSERTKKYAEFKVWQKRAELVQNKIAKDIKVLRWWTDNLDKIYDQNIEYPVGGETRALLENTKRMTETLVDPCLYYHNIYVTKLYESMVRDLYRWNMDTNTKSRLKMLLEKQMLDMIRLRYFDGHSCSKVAEETGYSVGTIYNYFSELKAMVKRLLEGELDENKQPTD